MIEDAQTYTPFEKYFKLELVGQFADKYEARKCERQLIKKCVHVPPAKNLPTTLHARTLGARVLLAM